MWNWELFNISMIWNTDKRSWKHKTPPCTIDSNENKCRPKISACPFKGFWSSYVSAYTTVPQKLHLCFFFFFCNSYSTKYKRFLTHLLFLCPLWQHCHSHARLLFHCEGWHSRLHDAWLVPSNGLNCCSQDGGVVQLKWGYATYNRLPGGWVIREWKKRQPLKI